MSDTDFENRLKETFPGATRGTKGRFWIPVAPEQLLDSVGIVRERFAVPQLAVIVGEDVRDAFQVNYVFTGAEVVVLQVRINREKPEVPSLAKLIPGSLVYERELYDVLGITPVGHPDLRRQTVPEDWPKGVFPLRKDVQFDRDGQVIAKEAK